MRLHVCMVDAKEFLGAFDRERLNDICKLAATVVAASGIALGVLVGENGSRSLEHAFVGKVFGRDHFQAGFLAAFFVLNGVEDFGIDLPERSINAVHRTSSIKGSIYHML